MKHRIVRLEGGKFVVQQKGWFFWTALTEHCREMEMPNSPGSGTTLMVFDTESEAKEYIRYKTYKIIG